MAGLRRDIGRGVRHDVRKPDVVDGDLDATLGSPVLRPRIEPLVVGGDEVRPLEDLQLACSACVPGEHRRAGSSGGGAPHEGGALYDETTAGLPVSWPPPEGMGGPPQRFYQAIPLR